MDSKMIAIAAVIVIIVLAGAYLIATGGMHAPNIPGTTPQNGAATNPGSAPGTTTAPTSSVWG